MAHLIAEIRQNAPHVSVDEVMLPCHIIAEWHYGPGITIPGYGCVGVYRCQGHFWGVPLALEQLNVFDVRADDLRREMARLVLGPERQDLGLISSGGSMTLVGALLAMPEAFSVGPLSRSENDTEDGQQLPSSPASGDSAEASIQRALTGDVYLTIYETFKLPLPVTVDESEDPVIFGVVADPKLFPYSDWTSLLSVDPAHGIQLSRPSNYDQTLRVYLRADHDVSPPTWTLSLREDSYAARRFDKAATARGTWQIGAVSDPIASVASHLENRLIELSVEHGRLSSSRDEAAEVTFEYDVQEAHAAFLRALATWSSVIVNAHNAIYAITALRDLTWRPGIANRWGIVNRLLEYATLSDDERSALEGWNEDLPEE